MRFLDNPGERSAQSTTGKKNTEKKSSCKKVISSGLLAVVLFSANIPDAFAAERNQVADALKIAASLPGNVVDVQRRSDIEEAAEATISSVRGIAGLMKQAYELSAMVPSTRPKTQAVPKSNLDTAISIAAHVPQMPITQVKPQNTPATAVAVSSNANLPGSQKLIWPVDGLIYSAFNATRGRRIHGAIDIVTKKGTPIAAAADGIVSVAANGGKNFAGYGKIIILDHGKGLFTVYAHCDTLLVKMGQKVKQGEYIGTVGRTGRATTDHCHFEVRASGKKCDPLAYLPSRPEIVKATNYKSSRK